MTSVDHALLHRRDDAVVDDRVVQIMAGLAVDEEGDRHAPCALAAQHPVGAVLDHRSDAVAALFGDEARDVDSLHRSEERRVGKEGGSTCRFRWLPYPYKKKTIEHSPVRHQNE